MEVKIKLPKIAEVSKPRNFTTLLGVIYVSGEENQEGIVNFRELVLERSVLANFNNIPFQNVSKILQRTRRFASILALFEPL